MWKQILPLAVVGLLNACASTSIEASPPAGGAATGGTSSGGTATGGTSSGGRATGGTSSGGRATGGTSSGGTVTGGGSSAGTATGGTSSGGRATGGTSSGGTATGGTSSGGRATGGTSSGGTATGGASSGGSGGSSGGQSSMADVQAIFDSRCVLCHDKAKHGLPTFPQLSLVASDAHAALVNKAATETCGGILVVPGNPDRSYLIHKLTQATPCDGLQMPRPFEIIKSPPLSADQVAVIRSWISSGAQP